MKRHRGKRAAGSPPAEIRIIGGKWRGRKLSVADVDGLRPTANRLRETLFNWLQFDIEGLAVLDLFAGTGALGLEALSRGAARCTLVETNRTARQVLEQNIERLDAAGSAQLVAQPATSWLATSPARFDIIFVDPPFSEELWDEVLAALPRHLNAGARVYLERPARYSASWPPGWECLRESRVGDAKGALLSFHPTEEPAADPTQETPGENT